MFPESTAVPLPVLRTVVAANDADTVPLSVPFTSMVREVGAGAGIESFLTTAFPLSETYKLPELSAQIP